MERDEPRDAVLALMDALAKIAPETDYEPQYAKIDDGETAYIPLSGGRLIPVSLGGMQRPECRQPTIHLPDGREIKTEFNTYGAGTSPSAFIPLPNGSRLPVSFV